MRKGRDGEKKTGKKENMDENSGHYVIASSRPPDRRPLERNTLVPKHLNYIGTCRHDIRGTMFHHTGIVRQEKYYYQKAGNTSLNSILARENLSGNG